MEKMWKEKRRGLNEVQEGDGEGVWEMERNERAWGKVEEEEMEKYGKGLVMEGTAIIPRGMSPAESCALRLYKSAFMRQNLGDIHRMATSVTQPET